MLGTQSNSEGEDGGRGDGEEGGCGAFPLGGLTQVTRVIGMTGM